jgi:predicted fused transcriptional regulator/phosphomethylpyrimidine kinase
MHAITATAALTAYKFSEALTAAINVSVIQEIIATATEFTLYAVYGRTSASGDVQAASDHATVVCIDSQQHVR